MFQKERELTLPFLRYPEGDCWIGTIWSLFLCLLIPLKHKKQVGMRERKLQVSL